jgi:hypothetical protein
LYELPQFALGGSKRTVVQHLGADKVFFATRAQPFREGCLVGYYHLPASVFYFPKAI